MPDQRRKSRDLPSLARQDSAIPPARRAWGADRFGGLPGLRHPALLRLPGRQADRPWQDPRRMPDAAAPGARRDGGRRHRDHAAAVPRAGARARHHRWRLSHPLARAVSGRLSGPRRPERRPIARGALPCYPQGTMTSRDSASSEITPEVLLRAYACGIFPMAESADDPTLFWVEPEMRGVIPLDGFHISSRLARTVRSDAFVVTVDTAFKAVMSGCAAPQPGREDTWINKRIRDLYVG